MIEGRATARYVRTSAQKAGLVMDLIRGQNVDLALSTLRFARKRIARDIEKVLRSAVANAQQREGASGEVDRMFVSSCYADQGPSQKRVRPAPMGRAFQILKRTAHLTVHVVERAAPRALPLRRPSGRRSVRRHRRRPALRLRQGRNQHTDRRLPRCDELVPGAARAGPRRQLKLMSLQPGTRLGNYEVISELGSGGMGEVYKAKDLKLGRDIAIKVLLSEMSLDPSRLHRFEQEARAALCLKSSQHRHHLRNR